MPVAPSSLSARPDGSFRKAPVRPLSFTIISGASAVSQLGSMSLAAAGPLLALSLTGSPVVAGCVTAASVLPELLLHVPAGLLADRFDRRRVMWWSQTVRVVFAVITCLSLALYDSVGILIVMALINASCAVFYEVAEIAAVPDLVSATSLNAAIGSNEAKLNASMLLGRPLGGALLAVNPLLPWVVTACTSLFPMFGLLIIGLPGRRKRCASDAPETAGGEGAFGAGDRGSLALVPVLRGKSGRLALSLRRALDQLAHDVFSRAVLAICVLANFLFQVIVLLQTYLAEREGIPPYLIGLMLSFSGVGGFIGAVVSPRLLRRTTPSFSVLVCTLAWVPLTWMAITSQHPVIGLFMWGLCSVVGAHINIVLRTHQVANFPNDQLGRIIGITRSLSVGTVALGAFSGGWFIRLFGVHGTVLLVGGLFTAIPILLLVAFNINTARNLLSAFRRGWQG